MTPTEPEQLTPEQRDELARMAGGRLHQEVMGRWHYVFPSGKIIAVDRWRPESSYDDCRPLLEEIERRGLRCEFMQQLATISTGWPTHSSKVVEMAWFGLYHVTPADIVGAFRRTIEAADNGENDKQTSEWVKAQKEQVSQ